MPWAFRLVPITIIGPSIAVIAIGPIAITVIVPSIAVIGPPIAVIATAIIVDVHNGCVTLR